MELSNLKENSMSISEAFITNILNSSNTKKTKLKKILIIASIIIIVILVIILSIILSKKKSIIPPDNPPEPPPPSLKDEEEFYSNETLKYINLITSLKKSNSIIHHFKIVKDEISEEKTFKDIITNYSLHFKNSSVSSRFVTLETYKHNDIDKNIYLNYLNKSNSTNYVFGPSSEKNSFIDLQCLKDDNFTLNTSKYKGITISFNLRRYDTSNNVHCSIFSIGNTTNRNCAFNLPWAEMQFQCGYYTTGYYTSDAIKIGYNQSNPYTRYLNSRPFTDNDTWHHIVLRIERNESNQLNYGNIELIVNAISRKNYTSQLNMFYGIKFFDFDNNAEKSNGNKNFYLDDFMIINRSLTNEEILILNNNIDRKIKPILPDIDPSNRCHIPGMSSNTEIGKIYPESEVSLTAEVKEFILTNKWTCIGLDYNNFIRDRIKEYCGFSLEGVDLNYQAKKLSDWEYHNQYYYSTLDVLGYYINQIENKLMNLTSFNNYVIVYSTDENNKDYKEHKIINFGYWLTSEGAFRIKAIKEDFHHYQKLRIVESKYYAFFELERPYEINRIYTLYVNNSNKIIFKYDNNIVSHAIKINQNGYAPRAQNHYAYIGRWMGTAGILPLNEFIGKEFILQKAYYNENKKIIYENLYSGILTWRKEKEEFFTGDSNNNPPLNGEQTLLINFTNYDNNNNLLKGNNFTIYIEGIGRSLQFSISNKAIFNAIFIHMKGYYQQRTGIEHIKPYTNWEYGAHHKGIYQAYHIPNNGHYNKIYEKETNETLSGLNQFKLIELTKTNISYPNIYGGHADAGDYDNRPYHLKIILAMAGVYLSDRKNLFMDNQFNIPESNDGIPDILNEMEWNLDIHYKIQQQFNSGGVSTWIEATSHPTGGDPGNDTQRYYTGIQTREDTLRYAESAALLAICFFECENCDNIIKYQKYNKWKDSAIWAWNFGINISNNGYSEFNYTDGKTYKYIEPDVDEALLSRAALSIYKLTNESNKDCEKYIFNDTNSTDFNKKYATGIYKLLSEMRYPNTLEVISIALQKNNQRLNSLLERLRSNVQNTINNIWKIMDNNDTYRNSYFYKSDHIFYRDRGWGNFVGGAIIDYHLIGYLIFDNENKQKVIQHLSEYYDFLLGCNHRGLSYTTQLGYFYPIRLLHHPTFWLQNEKEIWDPLPGITLYGFTGLLEAEAVNKQYLFIYEKNEKYNFKGFNRVRCPYMINYTDNNNCTNCTYENMRNYLNKFLPFWHRGSNIEDYTVGSSEFTIWETMSRMIIETGLLLDKDEKNVTLCKRKNDCPSIFPDEKLLNLSYKYLTRNDYCKWTLP